MMNELRTDAKMALARYESSYGAFGKDASFSMDDVYIVKDYINQLEAVADKFFDEIERLREAAKDRPKDRPKDAADEIERLRNQLRHQEHRDGRVGTHSADCYGFGPSHYECALREIERLRHAMQWIASCENGDVYEIWKEMQKTAKNALKGDE